MKVLVADDSPTQRRIIVQSNVRERDMGSFVAEIRREIAERVDLHLGLKRLVLRGLEAHGVGARRRFDSARVAPKHGPINDVWTGVLQIPYHSLEARFSFALGATKLPRALGWKLLLKLTVYQCYIYTTNDQGTKKEKKPSINL